MRWSLVRIEPAEIPNIRDGAAAHWYQMQLPLIADGRLAWSQIRLYPERARVERVCKGKTHGAITGLLSLLENQWTCVWSDDHNDGGEAEGLCNRANVRLIGAKFALGDAIGMRPIGGALSLYRVSHRSLLPAGWGQVERASA